MSNHSSIFTPCYETESGKVSIEDLLASFADTDLQVEGISRISDLHLKIGEVIRFRLDGELEPVEGGEPLTEDVFRQLVRPLLTEPLLEAFDAGTIGDCDHGFFWEKRSINFRLNLFSDRDGSACVLRMLPQQVPDIESLGFLYPQAIERITTLRAGLILVTGVTSSGKTTTVASLLNHINQSRKSRIITLEDPIEFVFKSDQCLISQRELNTHIKTFADGLRSALRENPDVIYVGEIRDRETAALALTAAETGHLVISTLHTKDVKGSFSRLVDMFPSDRADEICAQLSFSMAAIISQKLAHRKGQPGRLPVFEVLLNDSAVANLIRTGKWQQIYGKLETSGKQGMNTLEQHLLNLIKDGDIDKAEAQALANDGGFGSRIT
jgi:twitching motility protein PilT